MESNNNFNTAFINGPHHSFDTNLASMIGIEEAIIVHHLQFWIKFNAMKKRNFHEGKTWMYQSKREMSEHFPYLNYDKIRYIMERLIELKIIVKNQFNKVGFDKTSWYAFIDEKAFGVDQETIQKLLEIQESFTLGKIPQSIGQNSPTNTRCYKTNINKKSKPKEKDPPPDPSQSPNETPPDGVALASLFLSKIKEIKPNFSKKPSPKWSADCTNLLKTRTSEEIESVLEFALKNDFWSSKVLSPQRILKHLDALEIEKVLFESSNKEKNKERALKQEIEENKDWAHKKLKRFSWRDERKIIVDEYKVTIFAGARSVTPIGYADPNFKKIITNKMSDWGYC